MKSEARNSKSDTNPKLEYQMFKTVLGEYMDSPLQADITTVGVDPCINPAHKEPVMNFEFRSFEFVSNFDIRISVLNILPENVRI